MDKLYEDNSLKKLGDLIKINNKFFNKKNIEDNGCSNLYFKISKDDICKCESGNKLEIEKPEIRIDYNNFNEDKESIVYKVISSLKMDFLKDNDEYRRQQEDLDPNSFLKLFFDEKSGVKKKKGIKNDSSIKEIIKEYGETILRQLNTKNIRLPIREENILSILGELINKEKINHNLNKGDTDEIIRYVMDNIDSVILKKYEIFHDLYSTLISDKEIFFKQLQDFEIINKDIEYERLKQCSRIISKSFNDISDLSGVYDIPLKFSSDCYMVHPILASLAFLKLPLIENVIINEDYEEVITDLFKGRISKDNLHIYFFRTLDPKKITIKDYYKKPENSEIIRITASKALRKVFTEIRKGKLNSETSKALEKLLNCIQTDSKTDLESFITAICKIYSLSFTLVQNELSLGSLDITPRTVIFVEHDISKNDYFQRQIAPSLESNIYHDPIHNKVIIMPFTQNSNDDVHKLINQLILPKSVIDMNPFDYRTNNFPMFQKRTKILASNGLFILSRPRLKKKSFSPLLSFNFESDEVRTVPVEVKDYITINNEEFELKIVICYKINNYGLNFTCNSNKPSGIFSLVKTKLGWLKYDPNFCLTSEEQKEQYDKSIRNLYKKINKNEIESIINEISQNQGISIDDARKIVENEEEENEKRYKEWVLQNRIIVQNKLENMDRGNFVIGDFIIDEAEAKTYMETLGSLFIYAVDYDRYMNNFSTDKCNPCI